MSHPSTGRLPGAAPPLPILGPFAAYSPYAWMLPQDLWDKIKRWYTYTVEFVTPNQLIASGTRTQTVGIERDSHFAPITLVGVVTNVDNTTYIDPAGILVTIKDSGSGLDMMDRPVHWLNLFGRGSVGDGRIIPVELPRVIAPGSTISVTLTNLEVTARHVRISFRGFRIYGM